jgi:hypothetical protein
MTDNARPPAPHIVYVQAKPRSGLSTAALVLGVLAVVLGAVPFVGWLVGGLLAVLAIIFGIIGAMLDRKSDLSDKLPFAGILLGILTLVGIFALGMGIVW